MNGQVKMFEAWSIVDAEGNLPIRLSGSLMPTPEDAEALVDMAADDLLDQIAPVERGPWRPVKLKLLVEVIE